MDILPEFISGTLLMKRWDMNESEVLQVIEELGLQEYEAEGSGSFSPYYENEQRGFLSAVRPMDWRYLKRSDILKSEKKDGRGKIRAEGVENSFDLSQPAARGEDTKEPPAQEITSIMKKAKPEIERIYSSIKSVGFSGQKGFADKDWKEAALRCFDESEKPFKCVKREYLENIGLYAFSGGQEKRDFNKGILKKIMKGSGLGDFSEQLLGDLFKSLG